MTRAILVWIALITAAPALAQESPEVTPGGIIVIKKGIAGTVSGETATRGGFAKAVAPAGAAEATLIYMPPPDAHDMEDIVQYHVNGTPQTPIKIKVHENALTLENGKLYGASFKAIFVLFILAVLVESGLALLFHWRPFLDYFDSRSMNALVAFLFSYLLVHLFNLNIANELISIYTGPTKKPTALEGLPGALLTAMIIAGGSAAVNRIFQSFGFRPTSAQEQPKKPEPNQHEAWIAVTLVRDKAVGSAEVLIKNEVAGTISGASPKNRLFRYFIRDKGRFPQTAGYTVVPGPDYKVAIQGYDDLGNKLGLVERGPFAIAPRAIIDIELKV